MSAERVRLLLAACRTPGLRYEDARMLSAVSAALAHLAERDEEIEPGPERAVLRYLYDAHVAWPVPQVICCFCGEEVRGGTRPASHGSCRACRDRELAAIGIRKAGG